MKLSIIIPCHNEQATLASVLDKVIAVDLGTFEREILLIDDGSTDQSPRIGSEYAARRPDVVQFMRLEGNQGKGTAVREGLGHATGDLVLVQDADLEYDPADIPALLAPFLDPTALVVYGSRILGSRNRSYWRYYLGGRLVTAWANLLFSASLTDEPTGYKVFRRQLLDELGLTSRGFELCAELTGKLLARGVPIHEVPIGYRPRTFAEGKKIRWHDGLRAVTTLLMIRLGWRSPSRSMDRNEPVPIPAGNASSDQASAQS